MLYHVSSNNNTIVILSILSKSTRAHTSLVTKMIDDNFNFPLLSVASHCLKKLQKDKVGLHRLRKFLI